jgi:polar amino acid transport system permease protein
MHAYAPLLATFDVSAFLEFVRPDEDLLTALGRTLFVSVAAQVIGTILGVFAALGGMSRLWPVRTIAGLYVWFFRGTPVIVQIFFWFYGASILFGFEIFPREVDLLGFTISGAVLAGITALAVNEGAYMSEIVRAGITSVDEGQMEAALTVGMTRGRAMRRIVLPQAARVIVPGLGNEFNNMLKTSSLLTFTGVYELFQNAQVKLSASFQPVEVYLAVACWYLLLTTLWQLVQVQIERHLGRSDRGDEPESWATRLFGIGGARRSYA